jgi:hypothetical protein
MVMPADYLTTTAPYTRQLKFCTLKMVGIVSYWNRILLDWKETGKPSFIQAGPGQKTVIKFQDVSCTLA